MKGCHLRFTASAQRQQGREEDWWIDHRVHVEVFAEELEEALRVIGHVPAAGTLYPRPDIPGLRRLYPPRVALHLYYPFDDREVIVRAAWGARRGRAPRLR